MLNLISVCNAGILLEYGAESILIDGIARSYLGFTGLSDQSFEELKHRTGIYSGLQGILFTHCHPDHFDPDRTGQIMAADPALPHFIPDENTPDQGCIQCGSFSVCYYETPHMPHTFEQVRHFVLLVRAGDEFAYIAADAMLDASLHAKLLTGVRPDWIAVNPVYLTQTSTVNWLSASGAKDILIYHIPEGPEDRTGMRKKAERSIGRVQHQLPRLHLPERFPSRYTHSY